MASSVPDSSGDVVAGLQASHRLCEQRWFDDFAIGERFPMPSRTMTDAMFAAALRREA